MWLVLFLSLFFYSPARADSPLTPNPQGKVMIIEYHKIDYPEGRWTRTPENFRKDLDRFYEKAAIVACN